MDATATGWPAAALAGPGPQVFDADALAEPFFQALLAFLRGCGPGRPVLLSKVASCGPVQAAWAALQRSGYVSRSLKMKQLILRRPGLFRMITGCGNQPHVMLALPGPAAALPGVGGFSAGGASPALQPEQVAAIEAHLRQQSGAVRLSALCSHFQVSEEQLAGHFAIARSGSDCIVGLRLPDDGACLAALARLASAPCIAAAAAGQPGAPAGSAVSSLNLLLARLVPSRQAVCEAMAFCLDRREYAAALARRLAASMGEKGLTTQAAVARLYVISDVLGNCLGGGAGRPGAPQYLASFENLLPEAFDAAGREWFRRILDPAERAGAEQRVRRVLSAWRNAGVFTALYTRGLEALLFAPVLEDASSVPDTGADELLRAKLSRWFSMADQARLPYACQLRGLAGKALPTAACRARLCHFERYWHIPGVELPEDPDLFGRPGGGPAVGAGAISSGPSHAEIDDADSCDGEPLTEAELAELGLSP